jgi:hypothetical protein
MSWKIDYNAKDNIIELYYVDIVTPEDLKSAFEATVKNSIKYETGLIIADCRKLKGGHTLFDLVELIEEVETFDTERTLKEAVLLPPEQIPASSVEFWETACRNRGISVRLFDDRENAFNWLKPQIENPAL